MNPFTWSMLQEPQKIFYGNAYCGSVKDITEIKIYETDALLSKLSKSIGYNYLRDGYISFLLIFNISPNSCDYEAVMKHWMKEFIDFIHPKDIITVNCLSTKTFVYSTFHRDAYVIPSVDNIFWKPHIDIAWLTGHYISEPKKIRYPCDIDIIMLI